MTRETNGSDFGRAALLAAALAVFVAVGLSLAAPVAAQDPVDTNRTPTDTTVVPGETVEIEVSYSADSTIIDAYDESIAEGDTGALTITDVEAEVAGPASILVADDGSSFTIPYLNPTDGDTVTYTVQVAEDAEPGQYQLSGTVIGDEEPDNDDSGAYEVDSGTTTITVEEPAEPEFELSNLSPQNAQAAQGDQLTVTADVENVGGAAGSQTFELTIGNTVVATAEVTDLAPEDGTVQITFEDVDTSAFDPGTYTHTVSGPNGSVSGTLTIQPSVVTYTDASGDVTTTGLLEALDDWRAGDIDTLLLRDVIDAWRNWVQS